MDLLRLSLWTHSTCKLIAMQKGNFSDTYKKSIPILDKYFHKCLINAKYRGDYNEIKQRLIELTGHEAYLCCWNEAYPEAEIKALLVRKAATAWLNFFYQKKNKHSALDNVPETINSDPIHFYLMEMRQLLGIIEEKVGPEMWAVFELRAEGKKYGEIAKITNETEENLRAKISRLRKKLKELGLQFIINR